MAALAVVVVASMPANAANVFLLQLAVMSSREKADAVYQEALSKHKDVLKGYSYVPQQMQSLSGDANVSWRVLVGPFENRKKANYTCAELKAAEQDCFIVETAAIEPDDVREGSVKLASNKVEAPEISEAVAAESDEESDEQPMSASDGASEEGGVASTVNSIMPWNWFGDEEKTTVAEVAEGIEADDVEVSKKVTGSATSAQTKNININTHSVYAEAEETAPVSSEGGDLFSSISGLFASEDESPNMAADEQEEASVEDVVEEPVQSKAFVVADDYWPVEAVEKSVAPVTEAEEQVEAAETTSEPVEVTQAETVAEEIAPEEKSIAIPEEKTGSVRVAEAIPVPLSDTREDDLGDNEMSETITPLAPVPVFSADDTVSDTVATSSRIPLAQYQQQVANADSQRSVQISVFNSDIAASTCLGQIQASVTNAGSLRARIIKSQAFNRGAQRTILRLSPVEDERMEAAICDAAIGCGASLQCRGVVERGGNKRRQIVAPSRYSDRQASRSAVRGNADDRPGRIWVQLGSAPTPALARSTFQALADGNKDVLGNVSPTISSASARNSRATMYRLRVGPFPTHSKASALCGKLEARGVGCLVLTD